MKKFKLHYWIMNGGDGSAICKFEPNANMAQQKDEEQTEGFAEPSNNHIELMLDNDKLFYKTYQMIDNKYTDMWIEIE